MQFYNFNNALREIARNYVNVYDTDNFQNEFSKLRSLTIYDDILSLAVSDVYKSYIYYDDLFMIKSKKNIFTNKNILNISIEDEEEIIKKFLKLYNSSEKLLIYACNIPEEISKQSKFNMLENRDYQYENISKNIKNFYDQYIDTETRIIMEDIISGLYEIYTLMEEQYDEDLEKIFKSKINYDYLYEKHEISKDEINFDFFYFIHNNAKIFYDKNGEFNKFYSYDYNTLLKEYGEKKYNKDILKLLKKYSIDIYTLIEEFEKLSEADEVIEFLNHTSSFIIDDEEFDEENEFDEDEFFDEETTLFSLYKNNSELVEIFLENENINLISILEYIVSANKISAYFSEILKTAIIKIYEYLQIFYELNKENFIKNFKPIIIEIFENNSQFASEHLPFNSVYLCENYGYDYFFDTLFSKKYEISLKLIIENYILFNDNQITLDDTKKK